MYISDNCNWTPYGTNPELDKKVDSDDWLNRFSLAVNGYGLDKLINDEDWSVRDVVAKQGYGLDILINDKDDDVRIAVAKQGYGLDILINDEYKYVRKAVTNYLKDNGYKSIEEWAKANPDKVYGEIDFDLINTIKDFVYKIDGSNSIHIENYDEETKLFEKNICIYITTRDTNVRLIKIEKRLIDEQKVYKFIVDIDDYDIYISSIVDSIITFNSTLEYIIETLKKYPQFNRYVIDLENCL